MSDPERILSEVTTVIPDHPTSGIPVILASQTILQSIGPGTDQDTVLAKYSTRLTHTDPRNLHVIDGIMRPFRPAHAEDIRRSFEEMGYSTHHGCISWTWNEKLGVKLCIDGQHRIGAIMRQHKLVEKNQADATTTTHLNNIETLEYFDKDGKDIPISDIVILSAMKNSVSSGVAKMNLADKMTTVVSFLSLNPLILSKSASQITQILSKKLALTGLSLRTLHRYVTVGTSLLYNRRALLLFQRFASEKTFKSHAPGGMALYVLCNAVFTAAGKEAQVLCLVCLNHHYQACNGVGGSLSASSLRENDATPFFKDCCSIAGLLEAIARPRQMSVCEVLDFPIAHEQGGEKVKTSMFIAKQFGTWQPRATGEQKKWTEYVGKEIVQRLLIALPQKVVSSTQETNHLREKAYLKPSASSNEDEEVIDEGRAGHVTSSTKNSSAVIVTDQVPTEQHDGRTRGSRKRDGRRVLSSSENRPNQHLAMKRSKSFVSASQTVKRVKRSSRITTRSQTEPERVVRTMELDSIMEKTAAEKPQPVRENSRYHIKQRTTNSASVLSKASKKRPSKQDVKAAMRRRQLNNFNDEPGPLLPDIVRKPSMFSQLRHIKYHECLYDDAPDLFPLHAEHPAVSVLGSEGYLKALQHIVRWCKRNMAAGLFPKGLGGSSRDRRVHEHYHTKLSDRQEVLSNFSDFLYGFIVGAHYDLFQDGYTIIEAFGSSYADEQFPCDRSKEGFVNMRKVIDVLFDHYAAPDRCPDETGYWQKDIWIPITNVGSKEDVNARAIGATRMFSPRRATNETLAQENPLAYEARLYVDMYLAVVLDVLRLRTHGLVRPGVWRHEMDSPNEVSNREALHVASSGGRFILSAKGCMRQIPHCDFPQPTRSRPHGSPYPEPGYFMMVSGADGFYLYVWKGSHREINNNPDEISELSKSNVPSAVWVPPYSVLIGRGDVHHAGAGWEDWRNQEKSGKYTHSVRYHAYAKRKGTALGNHVYNQYIDAMYGWRE